MPPFPNPPAEDSKSVTWLLLSFSIHKEQKITGPTTLFLDHANTEFGFIRSTSSNIASVFRFRETDEPIYFQAKTARAAAWRDKSKKLSILFQHLQSAFHDVSETNIGGKKIAFVKADFDMEQQGFKSRAAQPWMAVPGDASE
ncbi:hypothetical protein J4E91_010662 [Alternaria rosae]|nr:hypothetical protein J4E91_010662 [Alternaria rosae]